LKEKKMAYCPPEKRESFLIGLIKNCWPFLLAVPPATYFAFNVAAYIALATGATGHLNPVLHAPLIWMLSH
jgi:hypothetical protein